MHKSRNPVRTEAVKVGMTYNKDGRPLKTQIFVINGGKQEGCGYI